MVDHPALTIATAGRAYPGETVSGDAWQVDWHAAICRVTVIDGLGHGPAANAAAQTARSALAGWPELSPGPALRACHDALRATRGAAMWIGTIDVAAERLVYAGIGNVDGVLWQAGGRVQLVGQRGIVGAAMPTVREYERSLSLDWLLVVYTDGVRSRAGTDAMTAQLRLDPDTLVNDLLEAWGRGTDDALILAARRA